tara:strand:- start:58 stop:315 length:258 start_codon:yes stop_codon:yes gene_type:complete
VIDEELIPTEQEYNPVDTQPPVMFVFESYNVSLEPDGAELSADPEYRLTKISPVPTAGMFVRAPFIMLYRYIVFKLSAAGARELL